MIKRKPAWRMIILSCLLISFNFKVDCLPIITSDHSIDLGDSLAVPEDITSAEENDIPDVAAHEKIEETSDEQKMAAIRTTLPIISHDGFYNLNNSIHVSGENDVMNAAEIENTEDEQTKVETGVPSNTVVNTQQAATPMLRNLRDGQIVLSYSVEITPNGDTFLGRAIIQVELTDEWGLVTLHAEDLNIFSIQYGFMNLDAPLELPPGDYDLEDGVLEMWPEEAAAYVFLIEYEGQIRNDGRGVYRGTYDDNSYLAMNLYPTHARRVYPCMDLLTAGAPLTMTFHNEEYNNIIGSSLNDGTVREAEFLPIMSPTHLWTLVAHNFANLINPGDRLRMLSRVGVSGQDSYASIVTQNVINFLNEYTGKNYFEIDASQDQNLNIFAMPDLTQPWHSLSSVAIWEPYMLMENTYSAKQQKLALMKMAETYAGQWFGYVIFPQNWRFAWVTEALGRHAAYEAAMEADSRMDMIEVLVADVIQESMLRDGYASANVMQPDDPLDEEVLIRDHVNGLIKYKGPALMHMLKLILGQNEDYVQIGANALINGRTLQAVSSQHFFASLNNRWNSEPVKLIDNIEEYLEPWITTNGYPILHVQFRSGSVLLQQERFGFTAREVTHYNIPITYTTSLNPDFENVYPVQMIDDQNVLSLFLPEEEWILFNIQGRGYYRVNYDEEMWERIIEALEDPDRREMIHPLNRATDSVELLFFYLQLVDDVLNLARAGKLDYETAFRVVLTMEHETNYAVWKAFVRNMDFLRKRLVAHVTLDEDLDPDIYLRMVRRTIGTLEQELTFYPDILVQEDTSVAMARGLVMDHACRANYAPCIAAAIDWFYDPNSAEPAVNPNIPYDIRPAVYCTMVREGDDQVIEALWARYEIEATHYERVVILESLGCSRDQDLLRELLQETLDQGGRFPKTERSRFMMSVMESSYDNAELALNFFRSNTNAIRDAYGGNEVIEEMLFVMSENTAEFFLADSQSSDSHFTATYPKFQFNTWVFLQNNNLDDNQEIAERAAANAMENLEWDETLLDIVYEWIDENDAAGAGAAFALLLVPALVALLNQ
ncbi:Membrane alanyl aminopeptidase [Eumeta japonica]|uniref:Membrane alanyl aminopeptidase n=1 Tax=Eumeta variegata TaxID=151549 RepID=A0A4C1W8E5_EUMVA|nr:Membrane alanyl aminopeptidase [Eumeta japonica]